MPAVADILHDGVLYARSVWAARLWGTPLHVPTMLTEAQMFELRHLAGQMALAMDRQFKLRWDTKSYHDVVKSQDGGDEKAEERFRRQFPTLDRPDLEIDPLTVWDITTSGELWYIPNAITEEREYLIRMLVQELNAVLAKHGHHAGSGSWRDSEQYFRDPEFCREFASGVLNLSLAWQMQGHEARPGIYWIKC
ncbi:hypothetical protein PENSPDRAFT_686426 [Peniophora sp. CONT]|nr:hypothetical protein PENSPDRAFT_686426 [Peniophora sp. CONT]